MRRRLMHKNPAATKRSTSAARPRPRPTPRRSLLPHVSEPPKAMWSPSMRNTQPAPRNDTTAVTTASALFTGRGDGAGGCRRRANAASNPRTAASPTAPYAQSRRCGAFGLTPLWPCQSRGGGATVRRSQEMRPWDHDPIIPQWARPECRLVGGRGQCEEAFGALHRGRRAVRHRRWRPALAARRCDLDPPSALACVSTIDIGHHGTMVHC